jgi:hypothetical protein
MNEITISSEDWLIVEKRLESMPKEMYFGFLSSSFTRDELLVEVKDKSDVGTKYALMQIRFIEWLMKQLKQSRI